MLPVCARDARIGTILAQMFDGISSVNYAGFYMHQLLELWLVLVACAPFF